MTNGLLINNEFSRRAVGSHFQSNGPTTEVPGALFTKVDGKRQKSHGDTRARTSYARSFHIGV